MMRVRLDATAVCLGEHLVRLIRFVAILRRMVYRSYGINRGIYASIEGILSCLGICILLACSPRKGERIQRRLERMSERMNRRFA